MIFWFFFKNRITYVNHVKDVFRRFKKFDLYVNLKKCEFFEKKIKCLNFIISIDDIKTNFRRINTIRKWFELKFFKNIQIYLSFAHFYRQFIHRYWQITVSLIDMLRTIRIDVKKEFFISTNDVTTIFQRLNNAFQLIFILIYFDSKLFIRLKTDVFNHDVIDIIF